LVTWSADVSSAGASLRFRGLTQGASALFASGEDGKVITASDPASPWFTIPSGTTANLLAGTYWNHRLYLVGADRTVLESNELYSSRLMNLSTRCLVGTGDATLISGFVVTGSAPKRVLIRAAGPAIGVAPFNVAGVIAAPQLTLFDAHSQPLASNSGWGSAANATDIRTTAAAVGAFPFHENSADSAILTTLDPGQYTTQVSGVGGATGVAILEVYDVDSLSTQTSQAINLSSRGFADAGDKKLTVGFVIDGASSRRVLIRAVGPTLGAAPFNVSGTLSAPQLELYNSRSRLQASAGAWGLQPNADEIRGVSKQLGAFGLRDGSMDSAMLVTLLPGLWTVQVGAPEGQSGVVLAEIYVLP
jgi:hypothetical protein